MRICRDSQDRREHAAHCSKTVGFTLLVVSFFKRPWPPVWDLDDAGKSLGNVMTFENVFIYVMTFENVIISANGLYIIYKNIYAVRSQRFC